MIEAGSSVVKVEHSLVVRSRPLHTIKEAAQAMIENFNTNPKVTDEGEQRGHGDEKPLRQKGDTYFEALMPETANEAIER